MPLLCILIMTLNDLIIASWQSRKQSEFKLKKKKKRGVPCQTINSRLIKQFTLKQVEKVRGIWDSEREIHWWCQALASVKQEQAPGIL